MSIAFFYLSANSLSTNHQIAWYEKSDVKQTVYQTNYTSREGDYEDKTIQCPIPHSDRVLNVTGIQCVFASIEALGRWAEEPKLIGLTKRSECQGFSSPAALAGVLRTLKVKFVQSYRDRATGLQLIRTAMTEHRGCLFDIPGHAMVLVHFDESKNVVKWIDNCDYTLKIQTMTVDKFMKVWNTWVVVIYADNDILPMKTLGAVNVFPIINVKDPNAKFLKDFVPFGMCTI